MKKGLKYTLISLGSLIVFAGIGMRIMYVMSPYGEAMIRHRFILF